MCVRRIGIGEYMMLWGAFSPLMFVLYECGMDLASRNGGAQSVASPSLATSFAVGCASGVIAAVVTSPIDVVKTRIQTQTPTSITQYRNMVHGLHEIVAYEGPRTLFRGLLPRCINAGLSIGSMMAIYSVLRAQTSRRLGYGSTIPSPPDAHAHADRRLWIERVVMKPVPIDRDPWTYCPM